MAARFVIPPGQGEKVTHNWRSVADMIDAVNALSNMTVQFEGRLRMIGSLEVRENDSVLRINENIQVGDEGT